MKVTMEVDCTPSEARRFLGLPDLELEKQILEQAAQLSPEGLLKSWLSAGTLTAGTMHDLASGAMKRAGDTKAR